MQEYVVFTKRVDSVCPLVLCVNGNCRTRAGESVSQEQDDELSEVYFGKYGHDDQ